MLRRCAIQCLIKHKIGLVSMTVRRVGCLQGQDVTQAAVTSVTTETSVHTTAPMSGYVSTQTTPRNRPATPPAHSSVSTTLQPTESSGTTPSSGAVTSTSLQPSEGNTGTNPPQTSATTLKAGSAPIVGSFSRLLLPVMVLSYSAQS